MASGSAAAGSAMQEVGQETVAFSLLTKRAAEAAFVGLRDICETCPDQSDNERKISLLKFILKTRQRLLRLLVICKWCRQIPLVDRCQQLVGTLSNHDMSFTQAADSLFYLHESLQQSRAPMYDVPSAVEVLLTGSFHRMPKCIEDLALQPILDGEKKEVALQKLDTLLRSKLLDVLLSKEFTVSVQGGRVTLRVDGEFEVQLTLGYRGNASLWRVLHLELLVGESSGSCKFTEMQRLALADDLERRMAALENPFGIVYSVLHEFCAALVMDTLCRQVRALRQGRWKDAIRLDLSFDTSTSGQVMPGQAVGAPADADTDPVSGSKSRVLGLKITYWLDLPKSSGGVDGMLPNLRIEPGSDQQISCQHQPPVMDPITENEAEFVLNQSCIDVEKLILKAINCNIHSRLVEVQRSLKNNNHIYRLESDVMLKAYDAGKALSGASATDQDNIKNISSGTGEDTLHVRAYADMYICLGISIRNGRFMLRAPETLLTKLVLQEMEEALNQGTMAPVDVFINLRIKSIIHVFASAGASLNLKVYEKGAITLKFSEEGPKLGPDVLILGFPHSGDLYFLALHLDASFLPHFILLEVQQQVHPSNRSTFTSRHITVRRYMSIDLGKCPVTEDDANLSLLSEKPYREPFQNPGGTRDMFTKANETKIGAPIAIHADNSRLGKILGTEQAGFSVVQLQRPMHSPATRHPSPSSSLSSPPSRTAFSSQSNIFQSSRKSSSTNNLLSMVPQTITSPVRNPTNRISPSSKFSEAEYIRLKSPLHHGDNPASPTDLDDDHLSKLIDSISSKTIGAPATESMNVTGSRQSHSVSPVSRMVRSGSKSSLILPTQKSSGHTVPPRKVPSEVSLGSPTVKESDDFVHSPYHLSSPPRSSAGPGIEHNSKRKFGPDILSSLPSLQIISHAARKRSKVEATSCQQGNLLTQTSTSACTLEAFVGQPYANIAAAANQGKAPTVSYMAVLLHVVKRCWLCIKHARLTSQMDSAGISYIEGAVFAPSNLIFRLPATRIKGDMGEFCNGWQRIHLNLGKLGSDGWEVKVRDPHYKSLWNLQKQKVVTEWGAGVQFAALSEADAHIKCSQEGLILTYKTVEDDSIKKLLTDLDRLRNARAFGICMKKLLEPRLDEAQKEKPRVQRGERSELKWEVTRRAFRVEAVGLTSLWFSYTGSMPGILARFVVEWVSGQKGCTVHVSPEQLWPHTKYLEDFINGGDVELLLDAIRITAGPLHALAGAIRPARMPGAVPNTTFAAGLGKATISGSPSVNAATSQSRSTGVVVGPPAAVQNVQVGTITSGPGRGPGPGIVPSSLLPTDISVLMRSPYWIRIVYRKQFSVDMRCFEGDQVWLQPAPPPQGAGPDAGGSLPCPQFRPFVMENVALGLNSPETAVGNNASGLIAQPNGTAGASPSTPSLAQAPGGTGSRSSAGIARSNQTAIPSKGNTSSPVGTQALSGNSLLPARNLVIGWPAGVCPGYRGELNSAFCGMSDDGGYVGAWVPLAALKKVLRGTLKYLGVLWLFAQFPNIIREVLGSIMNGKEGTLLHLDAEQPDLRFNIGNCMFVVNMHRHQLYLRGVNVKRFQPQPHQQQAQTTGADADLTSAEMSEITDFFARRVASEPYDASRLASFVTILTLPVPVLREFLGLISWKKDAQKAAQNQTVETTPRPRIELCLENRVVINSSIKEEPGSSTSVKSSISHDRERGIVEFALTVFLDLAYVPHVNVNVAGGAGWLPQCVSVKLRYYYNEGGRVVLVSMEGSHGGRACWSRADEWERYKEKIAKAVEAAASQEPVNGRLRAVAETVQLTVQSALQQLRAT